MESRKKSSSDTKELPRIITPKEYRKYNDSSSLKDQRPTLLSRTIDWVESLKVPTILSRKLGVGDGVFVINGIRKVLYGTQPAAEVVRIAGMRPPRYLCYMISGSGCDIIQFLLYVLVYWQLHDASLGWALSFGGSIVFRHTTHRYLVFGDYVGGYWRSLGRMYAGYSIIIFLSTIFNFLVTKYFDIPHIIAWILTMLWTGIVNYFILKKLWSFDGNKSDGDTEYRVVSTDDDSPDRKDIELSSAHP